jgi:integrase/recombinase XerD
MVGSTEGCVAELQSLLKFLYLAGLTPQPLATVVPEVAGWHDTGVPKAIAAADVQRLLNSCDPTDLVGNRDFPRCSCWSAAWARGRWKWCGWS